MATPRNANAMPITRADLAAYMQHNYQVELKFPNPNDPLTKQDKRLMIDFALGRDDVEDSEVNDLFISLFELPRAASTFSAPRMSSAAGEENTWWASAPGELAKEMNTEEILAAVRRRMLEGAGDGAGADADADGDGDGDGDVDGDGDAEGSDEEPLTPYDDPESPVPNAANDDLNLTTAPDNMPATIPSAAVAPTVASPTLELKTDGALPRGSIKVEGSVTGDPTRSKSRSRPASPFAGGLSIRVTDMDDSYSGQDDESPPAAVPNTDAKSLKDDALSLRVSGKVNEAAMDALRVPGALGNDPKEWCSGLESGNNDWISQCASPPLSMMEAQEEPEEQDLMLTSARGGKVKDKVVDVEAIPDADVVSESGKKRDQQNKGKKDKGMVDAEGGCCGCFGSRKRK